MRKDKELWLTGRMDGKFMLTRLKPVIHRVFGTRKMDAYERYGEPMGVMHLCPGGTLAMFGRLPEPLRPELVELVGGYPT